MNPYKNGDRILALWQTGPFWFSGRVHSADGDSIAVHYDDGTAEIRTPDQVKAFDWRAGSLIDAVWSGNGRWYEARIIDVNDDASAFLVRFEDDGIRESVAAGHCRSR